MSRPEPVHTTASVCGNVAIQLLSELFVDLACYYVEAVKLRLAVGRSAASLAASRFPRLLVLASLCLTPSLTAITLAMMRFHSDESGQYASAH